MWFFTNGMCPKNNTHIYVVRTSNNKVIMACYLYCCLLHSVKLCALAARAFRLQNKKYTSLSFAWPIHEKDQRWTQNRRQKVVNRGLYICVGGLYVRAGGGWHSNLTKSPLTYSVSYFKLGGLEFCLGGLSPQKLPMAMWLEEHVGFLGFGFKSCDIPIYWWIWMLSFFLN